MRIYYKIQAHNRDERSIILCVHLVWWHTLPLPSSDMHGAEEDWASFIYVFTPMTLSIFDWCPSIWRKWWLGGQSLGSPGHTHHARLTKELEIRDSIKKFGIVFFFFSHEKGIIINQKTGQPRSCCLLKGVLQNSVWDQIFRKNRRSKA